MKAAQPRGRALAFARGRQRFRQQREERADFSRQDRASLQRKPADSTGFGRCCNVRLAARCGVFDGGFGGN
jgi:hypothetical protein